MSLFYFVAKDGDGFQSLVGRLLTEEFDGANNSPRFTAVSSARRGDYGIDGFLNNGVVFQVFFPLQPGLGKLDFPAAVRSKLAATLTKLVRNRKAIERAIGGHISTLSLVLPEDVSPELHGDLDAHAQSNGLAFQLYGQSKLLNLFSRHFNAVRDCVPQFKGDESADALNTAAGQLWAKGANEDARVLYQRAYMLALAWNDSNGAAHALAGLGWCAFIARDLSSAMAFAREAGETATKAGSLHYKASAALVEAKVALAQGDLNEAEQRVSSALDDAVKGKSAVRWDALYMLSEIALAKDDPVEAHRGLDRAWRHDLKVGGRRAIAAYDLRATIFRRQGKLRPALACLQKAAVAAKSLGNAVLYAKYLVQSLHVLAGLNDHKRVLDSAGPCVRAAQVAGDVRLELEALMAKAWAFSETGKTIRCKGTLERVATVAESASCPDVGARACLILATKLRESGKLAEAGSAAEKAVTLAGSSRDPVLPGLAHLELCEQACFGSFFAKASDCLNKAESAFGLTEATTVFRADLSKLRVRVLDGLGRTAEAIDELKVLVSSTQDDPARKGTLVWAQGKQEELAGKLHWFDTTRRLLHEKQPLAFAGTAGATSLQEAHQWVLGILMDWWDGIGEKIAPCGVYGMWGEANYGRLLLNHRAFAQKSFHLCVEVASVSEARLACRMLSPMCDCLTLLWKGPFRPGFPIVPTPMVFDEPIRNWKPRPAEYWNQGARAYSTFMPPVGKLDLPYPIVKFYMKEARPLVEAGRLILVPGLMVGCLGPGHDDTERMFCDVSAADIVIRRPREAGARHPLEMVVPWLPRIPFPDLARLCEDFKDCLAALRQKCLEWSREVLSDNSLAMAKIKTEIGLLSKDVERAFSRMRGAERTGSQLQVNHMRGYGGQANREEIEASPVRCEANNRMSAFMEGDACNLPWFPYWSFQQSGQPWTLGASLHASRLAGSVPPGAIVNGNVFHWLKAPGEFAYNFIMVRKDMPAEERIKPGNYKMYEVKGGKVTEMPVGEGGEQGAHPSPAEAQNRANEDAQSERAEDVSGRSGTTGDAHGN
ncbi:MAG: hypothetical protein NTU78_14855 [Alphaproteobacteria bacterium]|nr:hypothetical protein [Alphaproteobacteria bacterium]